MRRTRILSTVGPASDSAAGIRALLDAGTDAFRLNFSHGTRASHAEVCRRIRDVAAGAGRSIAVLQDLGGPKIRIGPVASPFRVAAGDALAIERGDAAGAPGRVSSSFDVLFTSLRAGARVLVDEGRIELEVLRVSPARLDTRVITGGILDSHKGINVPGVTLHTSALTDKDVADLRAGIEMGIDLVAVSFVQSADDVRRARTAAAAAGAAGLPIIAKIEKPQAVAALDEILREADGVMVARGDLGIEMPLESLPAVQRQIMEAARRQGMPCIVATQVLESMRSAPRPTRAEVTDAAHAVDQGADAIMLAGETAIGDYPRLAVETLDRIIREAEKSPPPEVRPASGVTPISSGHALSEAAVMLAARAGADVIVAVTEGGRTARLLSALRPPARILAVTPNAATAARLALMWGVTPLVSASADLVEIRRVLAADAHVASGDLAVFVSMHDDLGRTDTNFVHVERL